MKGLLKHTIYVITSECAEFTHVGRQTNDFMTLLFQKLAHPVNLAAASSYHLLLSIFPPKHLCDSVIYTCPVSRDMKHCPSLSRAQVVNLVLIQICRALTMV
jgi:hypothetical protein